MVHDATQLPTDNALAIAAKYNMGETAVGPIACGLAYQRSAHANGMTKVVMIPDSCRPDRATCWGDLCKLSNFFDIKPEILMPGLYIDAQFSREWRPRICHMMGRNAWMRYMAAIAQFRVKSGVAAAAAIAESTPPNADAIEMELARLREFRNMLACWAKRVRWDGAPAELLRARPEVWGSAPVLAAYEPDMAFLPRTDDKIARAANRL